MSIIFNSLFRAFYNIYSTELSSSSSSSGFMTPFTNARYFLHPLSLKIKQNHGDIKTTRGNPCLSLPATLNLTQSMKTMKWIINRKGWVGGGWVGKYSSVWLWKIKDKFHPILPWRGIWMNHWLTRVCLWAKFRWMMLSGNKYIWQ